MHRVESAQCTLRCSRSSENVASGRCCTNAANCWRSTTVTPGPPIGLAVVRPVSRKRCLTRRAHAGQTSNSRARGVEQFGRNLRVMSQSDPLPRSSSQPTSYCKPRNLGTPQHVGMLSAVFVAQVVASQVSRHRMRIDAIKANRKDGHLVALLAMTALLNRGEPGLCPNRTPSPPATRARETAPERSVRASACRAAGCRFNSRRALLSNCVRRSLDNSRRFASRFSA
jgi:hypothetical protein